MDDREFASVVATQAGLAKEEAADLIRATLQQWGNQLSGGEVRELAPHLPGGLGGELPAHAGGSDPKPLRDFVRDLSRRTGLKEAEVIGGVRAIFVTLGQETDSTQLQNALSQLPAEYRLLTGS